MSYTGSDGESSAIYRPAAAADLDAPTSSMTFVAPGTVTRRQFGLFRRDMEPHAGGPKPHFHRTYSESFYILSGTVRIHDGNAWVDASAGDFVYVPKGGIHAFSADSDEPSSMLILFAPGAARERYFMELDEIRRSGRKLSPAEWEELWARHDQYPASAVRGWRRPPSRRTHHHASRPVR
jgi:mannose-6-phosphate isomerase-like protein (cupin superfamily)